jgi:hypothetical protein
MRYSQLKEEAGFEDLYRRLDEVRCAVRFASFEVVDGGNVAAHREVALRLLELQRDRIDRHFAELLQRPEYVGRHRSEFFVVTIIENLLGPGDRIPLKEFLGPGCDLPGRRLLLRGHTKNHLNHLFWTGDDENFRNVVQAEVGDDFTSAFLEPPYSLIQLVGQEARPLTNTEKHRLFFETIDRLFGGLSENCTIFRWSADSSSYFDAGKEWWGTYFYTVFAPDFSRIVGVVASTTD